jgi:hypothetical protein
MAKTAVQRQRRVKDTAAWRARQKRGAVVLPVEVDGDLFDLMARLRLLASGHETNRRAVADALGKLLRLALVVLRRELERR